MDFKSSSEDLKDDSPSQEYIGSSNQMKLDLEPVDDFEHIMKEMSPSKEATAQFLQHETTYATNQNRDKGRYDVDEVSKSSEVTDEDDSQATKPIDTWHDNLSEINAPGHASSDLILTETPEPGFDDGDDDDDDEMVSSKNFKQFEREVDNENEKLQSLHVDSPLDANLIGTESGTTYEEMKSGQITFNDNSDISVLNSLNTKNKTPTVTSHSLPGMMITENESNIISEKTPQGDGTHLKQTTASDVSDNEDHVPEPLPKDYPEIGVLEPNVFLSAIGIDNWFHPERLNPKVESLIYWRDVKKSGIAFGLGMIILLSLCYYSFISVVAYTALTLLGASVSLKIYENVLQAINKTSDSNPLKANLEKILKHAVVVEITGILKEYLDVNLSFNHDQVHQFLDKFVAGLHKAVVEIRRRILIEDIVDSTKFALLLWAMTYIGYWFNGLSLLILNYVALFTLPKVYENNKTQIDANLEIVREKINLISERIRAVIPVGKKDDSKSKSE